MWYENKAHFRRVVLRALKHIPNAGLRPVTAEVQYLLHTEVPIGVLPREEDVYVVLKELSAQRKVHIYTDSRTGGMRYSRTLYA